MITVKSNCYNDTEVATAMDTFIMMEDTFLNVYCRQGKLTYCATENECTQCPNRHLCYDIQHAKDYLVKLYEERGCGK